jgi:choline dehydrogenase
MSTAQNYDYIIVGAGSAGCTVAGRLSEQGKQVLLLEAGTPDDSHNIHIPAAFPYLFKTSNDWAYPIEPQEHCNHRPDYMPRGKMFGGSSSLNGMIYMRGHPANYDAWSKLGNKGWSWDDLKPYFLKSEHNERGASEHHAVGGPINVADLRDPNPLAKAFVQACAEAELPLNNDFNGNSQEGFGMYQVTQKKGMRHSAAVAYLYPALQRENFTAIANALVLRLTFNGRRCTGVVYRQAGQDYTVEANCEVILCGGAINSPQLLMLSGIGDREKLEALSIDVVANLPGVGQNYQDHILVPIAVHCTQPITLGGAGSGQTYRQYVEERKGLLTSNQVEAGGLVKLNATSPAPELQYHFVPGWFVFHGLGNPPEPHGYSLLPGLVGTKSKGSLELRSADPTEPPKIDPNYLADEAEMDVLVAGVKLGRQILASPAFDAYRGEEFLPGKAVQTDEEIKEFIRNNVQTIYHPVGTCKMGNDAMAVVNDRLQVHGIQGLRVADASIMPTIINANTNIPCIMIGEKCADIILQAGSDAD